MIKNIFLCIGSNIGDRAKYLNSGLIELSNLPEVSVINRSHRYETEPVGEKGQQDFLNQVVEINCSLSPEDLLRAVKKIEIKIGRTETVRWGPREIDIDILFFDCRVVANKDLTIPHRDLSNRRFALVPLAEIAPDFKCPESGLTVAEMLERCPDNSRVKRIGDKTYA